MSTASLATALTHLRREAEERSDAQLLESYTAANDQAAFAALIKRHGPMVLAVCRRVLQDTHDAEDAFQAVFLTLGRGAASIRKAEALTSWLHGVAYRTAMRARRDAARRRKHEGRAAPRTNPPAWEVGWRELQAVLDEEVQQLTPSYRAAFVLCCLEGLSKAEAAGRLGLKENTVSSQLARARKQLQERLSRRGITLTAVLAALAVSGAGRAAPPLRLWRQVCNLPIESAGYKPAATTAPVPGLSARAVSLAEGGTTAMLTSTGKLAIVVLLALAALGTGLGLFARSAALAPPSLRGEGNVRGATPPPARKAKPKGPAALDEGNKFIAYSGRVLGSDGRPVPGAKLYLTYLRAFPDEPCPSPAYATTGADGYFRFTLPKADFGPQHNVVVAAAAAHHGAGWMVVPANAKRDDVTIRLVKDDMPLSGQIVDLQGKPIRGATLSLLQINAAPKEDLRPWLEAVKARKGLSYQLEQQYFSRYTIALPRKATTDAAGRFRLSGIGRDRLVFLRLDGPTIASQQLRILTRPGPTMIVTEEGEPEYGARRVTTYYGANFRHVAAPTRPIVGIVRDKDTKKPLAGMTIRSYQQALIRVQTRTDVEGRYRLVGMPKGKSSSIVVIPGGDQPYVVAHQVVPDTPGLNPVMVDLALKRGGWIEGKITDKEGKPVQGSLEYFALLSNPSLRDYPGFDGTYIGFGDRPITIKADGSYRVAGLPGAGLLAIRCKGHYLHPEWEKLGLKPVGDQLKLIQTAPYYAYIDHYNTFAPIDVPKGVAAVRRNVMLDPGWTFTCTVLGLDGKPLAGVRAFGLSRRSSPWPWNHARTETMTVRRFNPRRPRDLLFLHPEKGLIGVAQPPKKNGSSVTVRMEPGATVTGRLVDAAGQPRVGVALEVRFLSKKGRDWERYWPDRIKTDAEGRFRLTALLPGHEFQLSDGRGELRFGGLRSGQTKDLGDTRVKPIE